MSVRTTPHPQAEFSCPAGKTSGRPAGGGGGASAASLLPQDSIPSAWRGSFSKLSKEMNRAVIETAVQKSLLNKLNDMRHNLPATKQAPRPKNKDKLPAGAAYTCPAQPASDTSYEEELEDPMAVTKKRSLTSMLKSSHEDSNSSNYSNVATDSDEASDREEKASSNNSGGDSDSEGGEKGLSQ